MAPHVEHHMNDHWRLINDGDNDYNVIFIKMQEQSEKEKKDVMYLARQTFLFSLTIQHSVKAKRTVCQNLNWKKKVLRKVYIKPKKSDT